MIYPIKMISDNLKKGVFTVFTVVFLSCASCALGYRDVDLSKGLVQKQTTSTTVLPSPSHKRATPTLVQATTTTVSQACTDDRPYLCPDGSCAVSANYCPTTNVCPESRPILCPDGSCVRDKRDCMDSTTSTLRYTWCSDIDYPSERMCLKGLCPPNTVCRFRGQGGTSRSYAAASSPGCVCVPCESVTTTTQPVRCEAIQRPSDKTCAMGVCPPNTRCVLKTPDSRTLTHATAPKCVCMPESTSTTLPERCETIGYPGPRACTTGVCPDDMECVYRPGSSAAGAALTHYQAPSCVCASTTTTLPGDIRCEAIYDPSPSRCVDGLCPPDYECSYVPVVTAANAGACKCTLKASTTTLPGEIKCEAIENADRKKCVEGVCPPTYECRYVASAAAANQGSCVCIPPTTTTMPNQRKCEALDDASQDVCMDGLCPPDYKCRYIPSVTAADVGECRCIPPTTSTVPGDVRCEAIYQATSERCAMGLCPPEHKCRYVSSASTADEGKCRCVVDDVPPTTIPELRCSSITDPTQDRCMQGVCPPAYKCVVVTDSAGVNYCKCVEVGVTTTLPQVRCEALDDPSDERCIEGFCPEGYVCGYAVDEAGAASCRCKRRQTTTTVRARQRQSEGFVNRIMDALFGWI